MREAMTIQAAEPDDAPLLTELALVSKAYWGYDAAFLAACAAELTITPDAIARFPIFTLRVADEIVGFYTLAPVQDGEVELDALFVSPKYIGGGLGRLLFDHAKHTATVQGYHTMKIQADPHAAPFYERMGACVVGTLPSGSIAGRVLPLLQVNLRDCLKRQL